MQHVRAYTAHPAFQSGRFYIVLVARDSGRILKGVKITADGEICYDPVFVNKTYLATANLAMHGITGRNPALR